MDPEKPGKQLDAKKGRPHNIIIIYYNTKILQEETCKQAIWKNNY